MTTTKQRITDVTTGEEARADIGAAAPVTCRPRDAGGRPPQTGSQRAVPGRLMAGARRKSRRMTLVEIMIASTMGLGMLGTILGVTLMLQRGLKSGQSQLLFHSEARYGTQRITRIIQRARIVSSYDDGSGAYIINPDDTVTIIYYEDADGDPDTVQDNAIWLDPATEESGDEKMLVRYVTPYDGDRIFTATRSGISMRYHVGDPANISAGDPVTGRGYQGLRIRAVAKPRNIGHIWTSRNF